MSRVIHSSAGMTVCDVSFHITGKVMKTKKRRQQNKTYNDNDDVYTATVIPFIPYRHMYMTLLRSKQRSNPYAVAAMKQCSTLIMGIFGTDDFERSQIQILSSLRICMISFGRSLMDILGCFGRFSDDKIKFPAYQQLSSSTAKTTDRTKNQKKYINILNFGITSVSALDVAFFGSWQDGYQCETIVAMICVIANLIVNQECPEVFANILEYNGGTMDPNYFKSNAFFPRLLFNIQLLIWIVELKGVSLLNFNFKMDVKYLRIDAIHLIHRLSKKAAFDGNNSSNSLIEMRRLSKEEEEYLIQHKRYYCKIGFGQNEFAVITKYSDVRQLIPI